MPLLQAKQVQPLPPQTHSSPAAAPFPAASWGQQLLKGEQPLTHLGCHRSPGYPSGMAAI